MAVPHGIDRSGVAGGSGAQGMSGSLNDLSDPGADRIVFWDDSEGDLKFLAVSSGLTFVTTTLTLNTHLRTIAGLTATDGGFIVGDGTNFVIESGATARASLGIVENSAPAASGEFVIGETASNVISVPFPLSGSPFINGQLSFSVSASILTIAVKNDDGSDPSASNPVFVRVRQGNPPNGTHTVRKITGALSVTISNGSTLGHANGIVAPVYVYALDNSGTVELAVSTQFFDDSDVQSTTAEGGAGGADSAAVLYSTTARTSVPIAAVLRWQSTQTSAGVWAAVTGTKERAPFNFVAGRSVKVVTQALSGTSLDFTAIPPGVKQIQVAFSDAKLSETSKTLAIQLGTAAGLETTNYTSHVDHAAGNMQAGTSGFVLVRAAFTSAAVYAGIVNFILHGETSNVWAAAVGLVSVTSGSSNGGGFKQLAGVLDRIRITTIEGTSTLSGTASITYS